MSAQMAFARHPFLTPQLRRQAPRQTSILTPESFSQQRPSRPQNMRASIFLSQHSIRQPAASSDTSSTTGSSLAEERETRTEEILQISEMLKEGMEEDCRVAARRRERRGIGHSYQEERWQEHVWVGQPKDIPRRVFEAIDEAQGEREEKINLLQGLLPELALFYYSVEQTLMFFEAQSICAQSLPLCTIQLERKPLCALFGIQIFSLGEPYFESKRSVMLLLHPFQGQIYHYQFRRNEEMGNLSKDIQRTLIIKPLRMRFPLPLQRPTPLNLAPNGHLYYSDSKGKVYRVQAGDWWGMREKKLSPRLVSNTSTINLIKSTTKIIGASLKTFARCVKNFTLSYWKERAATTQLLFDEDKEMIVVLVKQESQKQKEFLQYFLIYDIKTSQLLYTLNDSEFLKKRRQTEKEEIVLVSKLEAHPQTKFNFVLLLRSGRRVFLELHNDRLKRSVTIQAPPLNGQVNKSTDTPSFLIQNSLTAQLTFADHCYLLLAAESAKDSETVWQIRLEAQPSEATSLYHVISQPLGERKRHFLQYCAGTSAENMPQSTRQVFLSPRELYFTTEQAIQRIRVLRPIDIFYSLFLSHGYNVPNFIKKLGRMLPDTSPKDVIAFCCQLIVDPEGKYLVSQAVQFYADNQVDSLKRYSEGDLQEHYSKDIDSQMRKQLMEIMVDVVASGDRQVKQRALVEGVLAYYGRLLRNIFFSSLNSLSSEGCKAVGHVLQMLRKLLAELHRQINSELSSHIGRAIRWVQRVRQIVMLAKQVPTLPALTLDDALLQPPQTFHPHIFAFLVKHCREQAFDQVKSLMPSLVTPDFTLVYRLYCQVAPTTDPAAVLQLCRNLKGLPQYFIDYLIKQKKAPEAILLKGRTSKQNQDDGRQKQMTFRQKMKEFYSNRGSLYEKAQILMQANILLTQETYANNEDKKNDQRELQTMKGQLKLQQLILQTYHSRLPTQKGAFTRLLPVELTQQQKQVLIRLNTCLLQRPFLQELITSLDSCLLKVVYAYHFDIANFEPLFFQLAEQIFQAHKEDFWALSQAFQKELKFMLTKAELMFSTQEVKLILDAYLCLLVRSPALPTLLKKQSQQRLFWPLSFAVQLGQQANSLYSWGLQRMLLLSRTSTDFLYMAVCCCYLVRDFIPKRTQQYIDVLRKEEEGRPELKQTISLILS